MQVPRSRTGFTVLPVCPCSAPQAPHPDDTEYVFVDPHVLCTPNIADIDGDGHEEVVVSVSYFFDRQ